MATTLDRTWRQWIARRDSGAFNEMARATAGMVYATCLRILRNPDDARDVAQECYESLVNEARPEQVRSIGAWLHGVATYRSLTRLREERRRARREEAYAESLETVSEMRFDDVYRCVDEALARLPEELRAPLVMHFLCGRTQRETAGELGIPRRTLRRRIQQGLEALEEALRKRGVTAGGALLAAAMLDLSARACEVPAPLVAALGKLALSQCAARGETLAAAMARPVGMGYPWAWRMAMLALIVASVGAGMGLYLWNGSPMGGATPAGTAQEKTEPHTSGQVTNDWGRKWTDWTNSVMATVLPEQATVRVSGYVVDEDGAAVTDVLIGLKRYNVFNCNVKNAVPVDERGGFVCTKNEDGPLKPGKYRFSYCSTTLRDHLSDRDLLEGNDAIECPTIEITEAMCAAGKEVTNNRVIVPSSQRAISGMVRNEQGQPVPGAQMRMFAGTNNGQTYSAADGSFRFTRITPGGYPMSLDILKHNQQPYYPIDVSHPEYEPFHLWAELGDDNLEITLLEKKRGLISGTVVDSESGERIPNAKVWAGRIETVFGYAVVRGGEEIARQFDVGAFTLDDLQAGKVTVWAAAEGYGTDYVTPVEIVPNQETKDIAIALEPAGFIQVWCDLDAYPPETTEFQRVYAIRQGSVNADYFLAARQEDGSNLFRVKPGEYEVFLDFKSKLNEENRFNGWFCPSATVEVSAGNTTVVELGAPGNGCVQGAIPLLSADRDRMFVVRKGFRDDPLPDEYAPVPILKPKRHGAKDDALDGVLMQGRCLHSEATGRYVIEYLPAGKYTLTTIAYDGATEGISQRSKTFSVSDGECVTLDF